MYTLYQIDSRNICFLLIFHGKNGPYFPYFLLLSASLFVYNYRAATPLCICPSLWLKGFSFPSVLRGPLLLLLWPFSLLLLLLWQLQKKSRDATASVVGTNHGKRLLKFWRFLALFGGMQGWVQNNNQYKIRRKRWRRGVCPQCRLCHRPGVGTQGGLVKVLKAFMMRT